MEAFAKTIGAAGPQSAPEALMPGQILAWFPKTGDARVLGIHFSQAERKRHQRTYAHGDLGEDRSFFFRGPERKLNLRARNLAMFLDLAEGVDDETWIYHLRCGDYSKWFRERIKDAELADEASRYERDGAISARASREGIRAAVEKRYTAPA
jgi:hypothetical protein